MFSMWWATLVELSNSTEKAWSITWPVNLDFFFNLFQVYSFSFAIYHSSLISFNNGFSKTCEKITNYFEPGLNQEPILALLIIASSAGSSGYTDREEPKDKKKRKKCDGVACQKSRSMDRVLYPCGPVTGPGVPWGFSSGKLLQIDIKTTKDRKRICRKK